MMASLFQVPLLLCMRATKHLKPVRDERKSSIQTALINGLGIHVDFVRPSTGNSNTGNVARKFFKDPKLTAKLIGIDEQVVHRFSILLQAICCGLTIDVDKYDVYAKDTAELCVKLYKWYPMPVTVHKILFHGAAIIRNALVPIGQLSEEPQEARNKEFRNFREFRTRKTSRLATNEDLLNNLLTSSDVLISSMRKTRFTAASMLDEEAMKLLGEQVIEYE